MLEILLKIGVLIFAALCIWVRCRGILDEHRVQKRRQRMALLQSELNARLGPALEEGDAGALWEIAEQVRLNPVDINRAYILRKILLLDPGSGYAGKAKAGLTGLRGVESEGLKEDGINRVEAIAMRIRDDPGDHDAWLELAELYHGAGLTRDTREACVEVLRLDAPKDIRARAREMLKHINTTPEYLAGRDMLPAR